MSSKDLVPMANQIADFFRPYPKAEAVAGVAGHIRDFWEPHMRQSLRAHIAAGGKGLDELVLLAAKKVLEPVDERHSEPVS